MIGIRLILKTFLRWVLPAAVLCIGVSLWHPVHDFGVGFSHGLSGDDYRDWDEDFDYYNQPMRSGWEHGVMLFNRMVNNEIKHLEDQHDL